jgi:hypothetical protein
MLPRPAAAARAVAAAARAPAARATARALAAAPRRALSLASRAAEWITARPTASTLRFLEAKANEMPGDAGAQLLYLNALYK